MPCQCCCRPEPADTPRPRRRARLLSTIVQVLLLYVMLVFGGGTLIGTGHPVAVEVGRLFHLVTFVEPAQRWAHGAGFDALADGLHVLAQGVPVKAES